MPLHYHTEYCVGRLGMNVCRTRHGFSAMIAILVDAVLSVIFGLIGLALRLVWFVATTAAFIVIAALRLTFLLLVTTVKFLAELVRAPVRAVGAMSRRAAPAPAPKPAWSGLSEL